MSCVDYWYIKLRKVFSVAYTMCRNDKIQVWDTCSLFLQNHKNSSPYVIMILNRPISLNFQPGFMLNLWKNAVLRITVDGGTNRWLSWLKLNNCDDLKNTAPDLITGDMDSLSEDVLKYFCTRNTKMQVTKTPDQNNTDFTKAIHEVKKHCIAHSIKFDTILVLADTSGRFDQIIGNINTLYKAKDIVPDTKLLLLASNSFSWILSEGLHKIVIPLKLRQDQEWCALIPMGTPCRVTSAGLKWNLNDTLLEFGKLVSTSNTYDYESPTVTIETDHPIVWSMGIEGLL